MTKARDLADLGNKTSLDEINDAYDAGALSNRNLVINGDFQIAQRGTSHTYSNNQSGYHSLDRIYSGCFSSGGTLALSQQHAGYDNVDALKFLRATTAGTVGAGATVYSQHSIEGIEQFSNKQVTISFMVKANASTTFQLRREYYYGSGGTSTEYSGFLDVPVTTSWTKFTHTFSAVDFSSKTIGSSNYYALMFYWSTSQGSNKVRDGNIDITNIQLEVGDTATPFEHRSYGDELAKCHRYFQKLSCSGTSTRHMIGAGHYNTSTSLVIAYQHYGGVMRANPTATLSALNLFDLEPFDTAPTAISINVPTNKGCYIGCTDGTSRTTGFAGSLFFDTAGAFISFDAEL
jgi:hypothetical protein